MSEILSSPPGTCLPTLVHGKSLLITKIDGKNGSAEINGVKISHPDIVLDGSIVIHGVLKPFSSTDAADGSGLVPICDAAATNSSLVTDYIDFQDFKDPLHWSKIVRSLSSKGFVSFAIGLNSVLDGIRRDYTNLTSVTVFSPPDFGSSSSPVMDSVIRVHIVPRRISYKELVKIANTTPLKTLLAGHNLEVKVGAAVRNATSARLTVNGVEVLAPEIFSSDKYVVHGISRALGITNVSKKKKKKSSS
ncbi:Fasciclin-like arabinogalactan protein 21 [Linum perenne]